MKKVLFMFVAVLAKRALKNQVKQLPIAQRLRL